MSRSTTLDNTSHRAPPSLSSRSARREGSHQLAASARDNRPVGRALQHRAPARRAGLLAADGELSWPAGAPAQRAARQARAGTRPSARDQSAAAHKSRVVHRKSVMIKQQRKVWNALRHYSRCNLVKARTGHVCDTNTSRQLENQAPGLRVLLWVWCAFTFSSVGSPATAGAQVPISAPIDSGALIRVHLAAGEPVLGRLLTRLEPASTEIAICRYPGGVCTATWAPGRTILPAVSIARLDVASGTRVGRGIALGGLLGGATGLLAGYFAAYMGAQESVDLRAIIGFAALGALLGGGFGSADVEWQRAR